ncbi:MAG: two-component regulator propeller domain-containing protein, partial [Bacteroidota bacterium]
MIPELQGQNRFDRQFHFDQYRIIDGLSQNTINDIEQDSLGFIWLATQYGLNRFDGDQFRTFTAKDSGFTTSNFRRLALDHNGQLWVAGNTDLFVFQSCQQAVVDAYSMPDSVSSIIDVYCAGQEILILTVLGIYTIKDGIVVSKISWPTKRKIQASAMDDNHVLLINSDAGLHSYDPESNKITQCSVLDQAQPNRINWAFSSLSFHEDTLWASIDKELFQLIQDPKDEGELTVMNRIKLPDEISDIRQIRNQGVWVGHVNQGISICDPSTGKLQKSICHDPRRPSSLSHDHVMCVFSDAYEGVWVGTFAGGINRYDRDKYFYDHLLIQEEDKKKSTRNVVWSILPEPLDQDVLWLGMDEGAVLKYDLKGKKVIRQFPLSDEDDEPTTNITVQALEIDRRGRVWAGTVKDKIQWLDKTTGSFQVPANLQPGMTGARALLQLKGLDRLLIANKSGNLYWKTPNDRFVLDEDLKKKFPALYCFSMAEDPIDPGRVWLATREHGLVFRDLIQDKIIQFPLAIPVYAVFPDPVQTDTIWVGTKGEGLKIFSRRQKEFLPSSYPDLNGKLDALFNIVYHPGDSSLWLSGLGGLAICHPYRKNDSLLQFLNYDQRAIGQEFIVGSHIYASDKMVLGQGVNGLYQFDLKAVRRRRDSLKSQPVPIQVQKTGGGQKLSLEPYKLCDATLELPFGSYTFEISNVNFLNPERTTSQITISSRNFPKATTIQAITPNVYSFRFWDRNFWFRQQAYFDLTVQTVHTDSGEVLAEKSFLLKVKSPWYFKPWFWVVCGLMIFAG